jgi:hypothetical protein
MTEKMVKQIRKILKKENIQVAATYHDRNGEFRVKVIDFIERSKMAEAPIVPMDAEQRKKETQKIIIKVLMALSNNGLRPEYRTEQRTNTNDLGTWDSRYIIFK